METRNFKENNYVVRNNILDTYLSEMNRRKPVPEEKLRDLIALAQGGNVKARNRAIESNLRIVWSIAAHYQGIMDFGDILQNANYGLIIAVDTFDLGKGTKFSTWAVEVIRKYINIGLTNESRCVRMSAHQVKGGENYLTKSFDAPIGADEDGNEKTLLDTFKSASRADSLTEVNDLKVKINYLMKNLSEREKAIVCGIFGIGCDECSEYTLSRKFNISEERIRQIKWETLQKMRELA